MSVINRLEVANFLNLDDTADWRPDYRHVVFHFRGQSSAVNLANGGGKSTLTRAMLALLGRDQQFITATRHKTAPKTYGVYSHVRLELLLKDDPRSNDLFGQIGQAVPGEPHVFGLYGDSEKLRFYRYQGSLEDCPVAETHGGKVVLVDNETFRTRMRGLRGVLHEPEVEEWLREVDRHFERGAVRQMIDYQKRGAGDGTASFFKVNRLQNENYDSAFFYSVLAPELLVGVMGGEAEPDEHRVEDTILKSARTILSTMFESQRKEDEVATIGRACKEVEAVHTRARDFADARAAFDREVAGLLAEARFLDHIVLERPLPGIPSAALPDHPQTRAVAARLVLADGVWLLPDWAIGEITGEEPSRLNERGGRQGLPRTPVRHGQVIENPCDIKMERDPRGKSNVGYPREATVQLVKTAHTLADGWDREAALRAVNHGFDWVAKSGDTNMMRRAAERLAQDLANLGHRLDALEQERERTDDALKAKIDSRRNMDAARHAFAKMQASGLFGAAELAAPADTGRTVARALQDAESALATHREQAAAFQRPFTQWKEFVAEDGEDADPETVARRIEDAHGALQRAAGEANARREALQCERDGVGDRLRGAESERERVRASLARMESLLGGVERFAQHFSGEDPEGLEKRLDDRLKQSSGEHRTLTLEENDVRNRVGEMDALQPEVAHFVALFPGEDPQGLEQRCLDDVSKAEQAVHAGEARVERLQAQVDDIAAFHRRYGETADPFTERRQRQRRLEALSVEKTRVEEEHADARRRRAELDQARASAGRIAHEVLQVAGGEAEPLHEVVARLGLEPDRLCQVLTHFSALLFAPVAPDVDAAARIAARLFEEGLEAPVLVVGELADFCRTGRLVDGGRHVHTWMLGIHTRPVDCLLDPAGVEREKERLDALIVELEERLARLVEETAALSPDHPDGRLVDAAVRALEAEAPRLLEEARVCLMEAGEALQRARARASAEARAAVRARLRFDELGGDAALHRARARLAEIAHHLDRLSAEITRLEAQTTAQVREAIRAARDFARTGGWPALEEARARAADLDAELDDLRAARFELDERIAEARAAAERAGEELGIAATALQRIPVLHEVARFLADGGPAFMRTEADVRATLTAERQRADDRTRFEFGLAQGHVDQQAAGAEAELDRAIAALEERLRELRTVIPRQRQEREALRGRIDLTRAAAGRLDESVKAILQQWRTARGAVAGVSAEVPATEASTTDLERARHFFDILCTETDEPDEDRIERIGDIRSAVEAFTLAARAKEVEQSRKTKDAALRRLIDEVDRVAALGDLGLSDNERLRLAGARDNPREAETLYDHLSRQYREQAELLEKVQRNLDERRQQLADNLGSLSARVSVNFDALRRALAWKVDKDTGELLEAGLEVSATLNIAEIGTVIEGIIQVVEEQERHRRENTRRGKPLPSQEEHDAALKTDIRRTFYRGMFLDPRIRMRHPELKAGKPHPFDDKISTGQQNAIVLMLMLKLADFAIERDIRITTRNPAHRRKARALAQKVVIIDGLFSNLTDRALIRESMAAIARVRGNFQLIGWIHNPLYQNDPDIFPTFILARRIRASHGGYVILDDSGSPVPPATLGRSDGEVGTLTVHVDQRPAGFLEETPA
ncbi:MAG TPA: hypothetical protein VEB64_18720 [Azospirillaceae bacterium]|nr:hypothetical protein [Azospirillaceae bacterium]